MKPSEGGITHWWGGRRPQSLRCREAQHQWNLGERSDSQQGQLRSHRERQQVSLNQALLGGPGLGAQRSWVEGLGCAELAAWGETVWTG